MTTGARNRSERLNLRVPEHEKAIILEAARRRHLNVSQFLLSTVLKEAHAVIAEENTIRMSPEEYDAFLQRLDEPPQELPKLRDQLAKVKPFDAF